MRGGWNREAFIVPVFTYKNGHPLSNEATGTKKKKHDVLICSKPFSNADCSNAGFGCMRENKCEQIIRRKWKIGLYVVCQAFCGSITSLFQPERYVNKFLIRKRWLQQANRRNMACVKASVRYNRVKGY
jgi:hypothetical protein